jgi:hypothetical protein
MIIISILSQGTEFVHDSEDGKAVCPSNTEVGLYMSQVSSGTEFDS